MEQYNTELTVGMDLGNKKNEIYIMNSINGNPVETGSVLNDRVSRLFPSYRLNLSQFLMV